MLSQTSPPENPLVSVVIPAYNAANFIAETLDSLQAQTYTHWEAIVIDDQSTDNTAQIARDYAARDPRIQYHCLEIKAGRPSINRNKGMQLAKGSFVTFMDADDAYFPTGIEMLIKPLLEDSSLIASMGFPYYCDSELNLLHPPAQLKEIAPNQFVYVEGYQFSWDPFCKRQQALFVCCTMIRSEVLSQIPMMDENLVTAEDFKFLMGLLCLGIDKIRQIPACTYKYRNYAGSLTKSPHNILNTADSDVRVTQWLYSLPQLPKHLKNTRNYHMTHRMVVIISILIRMGEKQLALKAFKIAMAQKEVYSWIGLKYLSKEVLRLVLPKRKNAGYYDAVKQKVAS
jgi:glycosyltransferase involved in cell wall biosynthesis